MQGSFWCKVCEIFSSDTLMVTNDFVLKDWKVCCMFLVPICLMLSTLCKIFSKQHFRIFSCLFVFFFFSENSIWHFMQIVSIGDSLHEMSSYFSGRSKKNVINLSSAKLAQRVINVKFFYHLFNSAATVLKIGKREREREREIERERHRETERQREREREREWGGLR